MDVWFFPTISYVKIMNMGWLNINHMVKQPICKDLNINPYQPYG